MYIHGDSGSIEIKDKETGLVFKQKYSLHLLGKPATCLQYCFVEYIRKCNIVHNSRYEYKDYAGFNKPVTIVNKDSGEIFSQNAQAHFNNRKRIDIIMDKCLKNFNEFEKQAIAKYGSNTYKYINYDWEHRTVTFESVKRSKTYSQNIYEHLKGHCLDEKRDITFETFVEKANTLHNNQYEYSDFIDYNKPITVLNKATGKVYNQRIAHILRGCKPQEELSKYTEESFIELSKKVHNNRFKVSGYKDLNTEISVIDLQSGIEYQQLASSHLRGCLPKAISCSNVSKKECDIVTLLKETYPECTIVQNFRPAFLKRQELDIFIPELNLAIEYNGIVYHHSTANPYTKFLKSTKKPVDYHAKKFLNCLDNGIKLIHVFDFEYSAEILLATIIQYLNHDIKYVRNEQRVCEMSKNKTLEFYVPVVEFLSNVSPSYS